MTLQEFIDKYNGKYVEKAGSPNAMYQCVDLANAYIDEVLGYPIIEWTNAADFPSKAGIYYDWIPNGEYNIPREGDLVIWAGGGFPYGHIAIFVEPTTPNNYMSFRSFEQNYPTGSPAHIQEHNYPSSLKGWMRPKALSDDASCTEKLDACRKQVEQEIKNKNEVWQELQEVKSDLEGCHSEVMSYENFQKQLAITLQVENQQSAILGAVTSLMSCEDNLRKANKKIEELENSVNTCNKLYEEQQEEIQYLLEEQKDDLEANQALKRALEEADQEIRELKKIIEDNKITHEVKLKLGKYTICEVKEVK